MLRDIIKTEEVLDKLTSELIHSLETEITKKSKIGLLDEMAGIALYLYYYGKLKNSSEFSKIAENLLVEIFNILNEQPNIVGHDLAEGRTGIFFTLYFLSRNNFIKSILFEYEESIDYSTYTNCLKYINDNNIDFFYGAGGLLYLLFIRLKYEKKEYLKKLYYFDIGRNI
jgi:lantibiotic modifying enzyme